MRLMIDDYRLMIAVDCRLKTRQAIINHQSSIINI